MVTADQRIAEFVTYSDGVDRVTLGRELGLGMPTVVSAVGRLVAAGVLVETDETVARARAGRRPHVLRTAGDRSVLGVVTWRADRLRVTCHAFDGTALVHRSLAAPGAPAGAAALVPAVRTAQRLAERTRGHALRAVVFSVPAPYLHGNGAPGVNQPALSDRCDLPVASGGDLEHELTAATGVAVLMENDANLSAVGELHAGAGAGSRNLIYLLINDNSFGCALIVNGALVRGAHGYAGELAHLQLDPEGPVCECGGRGCLGMRVRSLIDQLTRAGHPAPVTFASIARLAAANDRGAIRMLTDIGRALGRPLAHMCTFLDPDRLVLQTPLDAAGRHVVRGLREILTVQAPPATVGDITVTTATAGLDAELHGAIEMLRERSRTMR